MPKKRTSLPNMFRTVVSADKLSSRPLIFTLLIDTDKGPGELGFTQESAKELRDMLDGILRVPPRSLRLR